MQGPGQRGLCALCRCALNVGVGAPTLLPCPPPPPPPPSLTNTQVCAPSNSALDEIVLRLISQGLTDREGRTYTPNVVRVGVSIHHRWVFAGWVWVACGCACGVGGCGGGAPAIEHP